MGLPAAQEVVLVPFPFSDLSETKLRPALCLAAAGRGDWLVCQITTKPHGDARAIALGSPDFTSGGLLAASYARPGKLFTANEAIIVRTVGKLNDRSFQRIVSAVIDLIRQATGP